MRPIAAILVLAAATAAQAQEHHHPAGEGGLQWAYEPWSVSVHGFANALWDRQTGRRGDEKTFSTSMLMAEALRPLGTGALELRTMLSLDPAMGRGGYPLLFQTGESPNGINHLIDRQHPHDFWMELGARYRQPWSERASWFVYAALPGEPALGPPAFMHRPSAERNPEAPISHHWLDATHITFGVVTGGVALGDWTLEASRFNGREPDEHRWDIETSRLDSWSTRVSWNPTRELSMQVSWGFLHDIEEVQKNVSMHRFTASLVYDTRVAGHRWATTLAYGRNDRVDRHFRHRLPAVLLESTFEPRDGDAVFFRAERIKHDEFSLELPWRKATLGYVHDFARTGPVRWGVGALASYLHAPGELSFLYGGQPRGYMAFLQARFS